MFGKRDQDAGSTTTDVADVIAAYRAQAAADLKLARRAGLMEQRQLRAATATAAAVLAVSYQLADLGDRPIPVTTLPDPGD